MGNEQLKILTDFKPRYLPYSYVIKYQGTDYIASACQEGLSDLVDGKFSKVLSDALNALNPSGSIAFDGLEFYLDSQNAIKCKKDGIKLYGLGGAGDYHLVIDDLAGGFYPRNLTVIYDDSTSGLDPMIQVGDNDVTIKGVEIHDLAFCGKKTPINGTDIKAGTAIKTISARAGFRLENVGIYFKDTGLGFYKKSGSYDYLKNNEQVRVRNLMLAFNTYGIRRINGDWWLIDAVFENIYGYFNRTNLIVGSGTNCFMTNTTFKNVIAQTAGCDGGCPINVKVCGNVEFDNVWIDNNWGDNASGTIGIRILCEDVESGKERTWCKIKNPVLHGIDGEAIQVDGTGQANVFIEDPYIGLMPNAQSPCGGLHGIHGKIVKNNNTNANIFIRGGYVKSELSKSFANWFSGILAKNIMNVVGFITQNFGVYTASGNGSQTVFTIPHGMDTPPTNITLEAKTADAAGIKYWSADATNITVTFLTAPPTGTNNMVITWKGEA